MLKRNLSLNFKYGKKGQLYNILLFVVLIVVVFAMAVSHLFSFQILSDINDDFQAEPEFSNQTKEATQVLTNTFPGISDTLVVLVLVVGWFVALISAYYSVENPLLIVVMLVIIIALLLCSALLSNAWEDITNDYPSVTTNFPISNFVLSNYMLVFAVITLSCLGMIGLRRF